ncbi:MAG: bifunctional serine/threonine-protein kinase/formylglycine-generating enzyme family protein [Chthoniobacter sp.]|uniref:bifunctional serine/threonine-protein kinase/formylglycine-generating enzyme family protein n=1 Tax=Chthoniobacter sp. TaxID=2510640 RepID=UPI0032A2B1F2
MPSTADNRQAPHVPNHEMVRSIGRGSYGEIWLARSLTGTWRAVKIVDRRTFESDKAFQREFEGMAKFEPISREDAGFVDILHVGRDPGDNFFYYVMELADDHLGCASIDPVSYVPKTIKTELSRRSRLLADECITIGLSLTKALGALHRQGLVHRDIKPANIIFVGGVPKIADIGLVAASGQDSYVGTEGYVPPEGPGSPQADIYSLGKVLYELAMGKDRMDFPAVNTDIAELPDKAMLLRLNEVLLRACDHDCGERYANAEEMHDDLLRLRDGEELAVHARRRRPLFASLAVLLLLGSGGFYALRQYHSYGSVRIETDPPGAWVALDNGAQKSPGEMPKSPAEFAQLPIGRHSAHIMLAGYEPADTSFEVKTDEQVRPKLLHLQRSHGTAQINSLPAGAAFELKQENTVVKSGVTPATLTDLPTGDYVLVMKLGLRQHVEPLNIARDEITTKEHEFTSGVISVTCAQPGVMVSLDGEPAVAAPVEIKTAEASHELVATYRNWPEQRRTVQADHAQPTEVLFDFPCGSVKITSAPSGATVWQGDQELGLTPLPPIEDLDPGPVKYELRLAGYKNIEVSGVVEPGKQKFLEATFFKRIGPRRGEPWENSLGMRFVPVGDVLASIWPTRVVDYDAFCTATGRQRPVPDFAQDGLHPVVKVSWEDATAFCEWLTKRELAAERLEPGQSYRLPIDREWSAAAGMTEEGGSTPEERDGKVREFPWGKQWPPPPGSGNFADFPSKRGAPAIPGYHDGFAQTSPVGSFPPNRMGLFDMSGNVWQWCQDSYKGGITGARDWGVLRGGSWGTASPSELRSSYRNVVERAERDVIYGFRCVLVPEK